MIEYWSVLYNIVRSVSIVSTRCTSLCKQIWYCLKRAIFFIRLKVLWALYLVYCMWTGEEVWQDSSINFISPKICTINLMFCNKILTICKYGHACKNVSSNQIFSISFWDDWEKCPGILLYCLFNPLLIILYLFIIYI